MNEDPMEMLTEDAARRTRALEERYIDEAIIGGARDAASFLDKTEVRDQVAQIGFMHAVAAQNADIKPPPRPGPKRRPKRTLTKRQAVKAARKRNR